MLLGLIAGAAVVAGGVVAFSVHSHNARTVTSPVSTPRATPAAGQKSPEQGGPVTAPLMMPVSGKLQSGFGWQYSGALNEWYYNPGITISADQGSPVRAAWAGTVDSVANEPHMGITVTVNDGDGFETVYGHLGSAAVKAGESVKQGQTLGTVGGQSLYSRQPGAHLDFQVFHGKTAANPLSYLHPSS